MNWMAFGILLGIFAVLVVCMGAGYLVMELGSYLDKKIGSPRGSILAIVGWALLIATLIGLSS